MLLLFLTHYPNLCFVKLVFCILLLMTTAVTYITDTAAAAAHITNLDTSALLLKIAFKLYSFY